MRNPNSKIKAPASLCRLVRRIRGKKRVIFTNGCFDILHPGHVQYLFQARRKGDLLIVALNTDASVRKLKGPSRPVNNLQARLRVLSGLECVDYVTWFPEATPLQIILKLRPNLVVKGGDWKPADIVGGKEARSWGGKALSLPFSLGHSTSAILKRIQE